ncbi:MAG: HEAT repeat domain-containing protein [Oscillatoria princeps RMCB-10]|jgi:HEAT repeat protein/energy-coupling factor transporter ATP-binding protein EcfA2|nr:HEAT repeat domain-containing protein [Oscillatoria princeps RMCB-10]
MNAGEQGRNPEVEAKFLEAMARDRGFAGKTQAVFIQRFSKDNERQENKSLAASVWPNQDEAVNREQTFQDHLQKICQELALAGCPIVKSNKPGRRRKGEEPWNQAFKWLWETEFPNWQPAQKAKSPSPTAISIDWRQVCRTLLDVQRQLTSNFLTHADGIELDLDGVYVPLGLVERKERPKRGGDVSPERGSELSQPTGTEIEIAKKYESDEFFQEALLQGNTPKSQGKRLLIAGEPGAGKTTLLQKSAGWVLKNTDLVPVWISLGAVGDIPLDKYLQEVWLRDAAGKLKSAPPEWLEALEQLLDSGQVLLLLDGADEMGVGNPLAALNKQLSAGWAQKVRVMLTCRVNVWDATPNALTGFDTYRTLEFSCGKGSEPDRVGEFIDNFFKNSNPERGKRLRAALDEPGKERIKDLVKNPLRLTLLCRTWHKREGGLPETKAQLYEQFVRALYKWKGERFPTTPKQREALNAKLGELALRAMGGESSRFRLRYGLVCQVLGDPEDEESLGYLALKLGWINTVGVAAENPDEPVYAFYHPTFEEYFAARAVGDDWRFFLNHTLPPSPAMSNYRIFEPQWKEVILLWLGREDVARERKEEFIKALLEFEDRCGNFYTVRGYLLAAAGVAEFKDCSRADKIVAQIVKFGFGDFDRKKQKWASYPYPIKEGARAALLQTVRPKAINLLVGVIGKSQNVLTRWEVAEILGKIGHGNSTAIDALVKLIRTSQERDDSQAPVNESTLMTAADNLGKIDQSNQTAIDALVELIRTSQSESTRLQAAEILGKIDRGNPTAIAALVDLIVTSQDEDIYMPATFSLEEIGQGNPTAIAALVELIRTSEDEDTCQRAAWLLGEIGQGDKEAIDALVQLIRNSKEKDTRRAAAESLGAIDKGNPTAIAALVELIGTSQDKHNRQETAENLGQIGQCSSTAMDGLVIFSDGILELTIASQDDRDDKDNRRQAAESLEKIGQGSPTAIEALVELIRTSQDGSTRRQAAESLKKILAKSQMALAVTGLKDCLFDETYENDSWRFHDCYTVIWHCAQRMPYPEFYQAWHTQTTGTPPQSLTLANLPQVLASAIARQAQLQESVKLICINAEPLSGETDTGEIAQHLCNKIYSAAFPNSTEIPPEVNSAAQLARQLTALKCRVKTPALALILHSCAPEPALVKFCRKLTDTAHIGWIASTPVESPLRGFVPNQPNLVSEILSWLDELAR